MASSLPEAKSTWVCEKKSIGFTEAAENPQGQAVKWGETGRAPAVVTPNWEQRRQKTAKKKSSRRKTLQVEYPRHKASLFLFYLVSAALPRCDLGCLLAYPRAAPAGAQGVLRRGLFEEQTALLPLKK